MSSASSSSFDSTCLLREGARISMASARPRLFDQPAVLAVEDAAHEEVPEPPELASGLGREHRRVHRDPTLALGLEPDVELGARPELSLEPGDERVPLPVRRQVREDLPDLLGSPVELDLRPELLHCRPSLLG